MQAPIYIYHIFDADKKPLYLDGNGNVQRGNPETLLQQDGVTPARLRHSPEGWRGTLIKYFRNINKWGLLRDMTVPMKFPADGAQILKYYKWTYGSEAVLYLGISRLDLYSQPDRYETMYLSEINLAKFRQVRGGVVVEAMEGYLSKLLKAYENTTYEIPIDDYQAFYMRMDGVLFDYTRTFTIVENQEAVDTDSYVLGGIESAREGAPKDGIIFRDQFQASSSAYPNESYHLWKAAAGTVRIRGKVKVKYHQNITVIVRAEVNDGATSGGTTQYNLMNRAGTTNEEFEQNFDISVNIPAGYRLHFKHTMFNPVDTGLHYTILSGEFTIEYTYRKAETHVKCLSAFRVLELIMNKMTDGLYEPVSTFLQTDKSIAITCGDALRGISGAVIKTSINDFIKSMLRFGIGTGIRNGKDLILERFIEFFKSNVGISLGEVSSFEIEDANDIKFNGIKCGYPKKDYTDVNGRYEMNQGQNWVTPIKKEVREYDIVSVYRADCIGIELMRINFENKASTDGNGDNDVFMIHKQDTPSGTVTVDTESFQLFDLFRPAYTSITGVPHAETWFNTEWTPKKSLLANGSFIRSVHDFQDQELIKVGSADKNKEFSTTISGVTVTEKEDIQIGGLDPRAFRPYYFSFKTRVPITLPEILLADPYGKVEFKYEGITYYGYLMDGAIQPADNDTQTWKLLCAADTDVSKFIKNFN